MTQKKQTQKNIKSVQKKIKEKGYNANISASEMAKLDREAIKKHKKHGDITNKIATRIDSKTVIYTSSEEVAKKMMFQIKNKSLKN